MPETNQQKKWLEAMRQRAELMNDLYARIAELSEQRDRAGIVRHVARTLEATPIEAGNSVLIGSLEIEFDDDGSVLDVRSDDGTASFSVKPVLKTD